MLETIIYVTKVVFFFAVFPLFLFSSLLIFSFLIKTQIKIVKNKIEELKNRNFYE